MAKHVCSTRYEGLVLFDNGRREDDHSGLTSAEFSCWILCKNPHSSAAAPTGLSLLLLSRELALQKLPGDQSLIREGIMQRLDGIQIWVCVGHYGRPYS